jgi:hypothetical protein
MIHTRRRQISILDLEIRCITALSVTHIFPSIPQV